MEAYAACAWGETHFICHTKGDAEQLAQMEEKLREGKVNSQDAQTRSAKDKEKIDALITNGSYLYDPISFGAIDVELKVRLLEAVRVGGGSGGGCEVVVEGEADVKFCCIDDDKCAAGCFLGRRG